jgi:hypothetical protein
MRPRAPVLQTGLARWTVDIGETDKDLALSSLEAPDEPSGQPSSDRVEYVARPEIIDVPFPVLNEESLEALPFAHHRVVDLRHELLRLGECSRIRVVVDPPGQDGPLAIVQPNQGWEPFYGDLETTDGVESVVGGAVFDQGVGRDPPTGGRLLQTGVEPLEHGSVGRAASDPGQSQRSVIGCRTPEAEEARVGDLLALHCRLPEAPSVGEPEATFGDPLERGGHPLLVHDPGGPDKATNQVVVPVEQLRPTTVIGHVRHRLRLDHELQ